MTPQFVVASAEYILYDLEKAEIYIHGRLEHVATLKYAAYGVVYIGC